MLIQKAIPKNAPANTKPEYRIVIDFTRIPSFLDINSPITAIFRSPIKYIFKILIYLLRIFTLILNSPLQFHAITIIILLFIIILYLAHIINQLQIIINSDYTPHNL